MKRLLATSGFGRSGLVALGLLKHVPRPPLPALGHLGNSKQPIDFIVSTGVDAKYIADRQIMIGSLDYPDLIAGPHITLDDYSEVRPRSQCLGEAAWKPLIVHPNSEPPARDSRLGNLENRRRDLPTLPDERIVHLNPFCREIFAEFAVCKRSAHLLFPPPRVFDGVCIDRFIGSPDRKSTRLNSSHLGISYAVFCLKKKKTHKQNT